MKYSKGKSKTVLKIILLALVGVAIFYVPAFIPIKSVECVSQFGPCRESTTLKLSGFKNSNFREAKTGISKFLQAETGLAEFSVRLKLPGTLVITVVEKKMHFALKSTGASVYANLAPDGEVLALEEETSLPYIVTPGNPPNLGEKVSEEILFALQIQERLFSLYQARHGEITSDYLKVELPEGYTALLPLKGDVEELLGALSLIIYELKRPKEDSRIEGVVISTIDLRFANPVLR